MKILTYSINSMLPTLYSYIAASFFYSYRKLGGADLNAILSNILSFSASSPFYFIRYYILLSLWAPLLFTIIKLILMKPAPKLQKAATMICFFVILWTPFILILESITKRRLFHVKRRSNSYTIWLCHCWYF